MNRIIASVAVVAILVAVPGYSQAATYTNYPPAYNTMTVDEKIAYLYGMIAQLQFMLQVAANNDGYQTVVGEARPRNTNRNQSDVTIETLSASSITDDEALLRARVDLEREDEALVWFEYGEDDDDLDERTTKRRVYDNHGDRQTVSIRIDDLDEDERYYFRAVVEDEDGDRSFGTIRNFTTDDDNSSNGSTGDYELEVNDTSIEAGDDVRISWEIPSAEEGTKNWIGLYRIGTNNNQYIKWVYLDNDNAGTETFRIDQTGRYEFRLFLNNSYEDEVVSEEVVVW